MMKFIASLKLNIILFVMNKVAAHAADGYAAYLEK